MAAWILDEELAMIKVIAFIKKLPTVTADQFRDYYEEIHAPLIDELLPFYATYRRNYVTGSPFGRPIDLNFDVVTELEFADDAAYQAWIAALSNPEISAKIKADEAHFIDQTATVLVNISHYSSAY